MKATTADVLCLEEVESLRTWRHERNAAGTADRWAHFWADGNEYRQVDHLWVGRALWDRAGQPAPQITRNGLPYRAERYTGERFPDVGDSHPKASDHCPVTVEFPLDALV